MARSLGGAFDPGADYTTTGTWTDGTSTRLYGTTEPVSGGIGVGTGQGVAAGGSTYLDTNRKVLYINETNATAPYWTPLNAQNHPNLISFYTDFKDFVGEPLADTDTSLVVPGSGLRIFGQGLAETDSGVVCATDSGCVRARLTTTDEAEHLVALSFGSIAGSTLYMKPASWGPMVIEATVAMVSALTLRNFFIGFIGGVAADVGDALDPPGTAVTTTLTLVQDDLAGLYMDSRLTDATRIFAPHNKADEAATLTAASCITDPSTVFSAAGTDVRFRVEITRTGTMYGYVNRTLVANVPLASSTSVALAPVLLVGSTSAAIKAMDVRRFAVWSRRI